MNNPTRLRPIISIVLAGTALAQLAAPPVLADSAVGVDTLPPGNALNTGIARATPDADPEASPPKRSPIGRLYDWTYRPREDARSFGAGWEYTVDVEAGGLYTSGDDEHVLFRRYKDLDGGLYLRRFTFEADQADDGDFFSVIGGGPGYDDQYWQVSGGRHNVWKATAFLNETPAYFTSNFRSLWSGAGSGYLPLLNMTPGGLATAAATQAALRTELAGTGNSTLALTRTKYGTRLDFTLNDKWKAYASYSNEEREGARPYAMVFGGAGGGGNIEIPESIDYDTMDMLAGIQYVDPLNAFNLQLSASMFRNNIDTQTIENPLTITVNTITGIPATAFTTARFDQYPDNDFLKAKAEFARQLPKFWNGRLTAVVATTRSEQDDGLIAPTTMALTGGLINGISTANVWNTTGALSDSSPETQIDTTLFSLGLTVHPGRSLTLKADARHYETDNSLEYRACNPLTGQWGRLTNDGSGGSFVNTPAYLAAACDLDAVRALGIVPSAGNVPIAAVPYEYEQTNYSLLADYRGFGSSNLSLRLEREEFDRAYRERASTEEDRIKLGYTNHGFERATLLLSFEYTDRGGSRYVVEPHEEFVSATMGPGPTTGNVASWFHNIDTFRKLDMADRRQNILNARVNFLVTETLDVALSGQLRDVSYPDSDYGRRSADQTSVSLEANYQPSATFGVWGGYTWQTGDMSQRGLQANACAIGATYYFFSNGAINTTGVPPAGTTLVGSTPVTVANFHDACGRTGPLSPLYPTSRTWDNEQQDDYHMANVGLRYDVKRLALDVSYTYVLGRTETDYRYNPAALGLTAVQVAMIGSGMPDQVMEVSTFDVGLEYRFSETVSTRLFARHEFGRIRDWHYDGVAQNPVPAVNAAYLDAGPDYRYDASLFGIFVRVQL